MITGLLLKTKNMMIIIPYSISYSYDYHIPIIIFHIHIPIYDEWWLRFHIKNRMLDYYYTPFVSICYITPYHDIPKIIHIPIPIGSMCGIYANIGGILMGSMLPYIAAPWILWDIVD